MIGVFADMATAYLIRDAELAETKEMAQQLQGALDSRVIIEQAKGVLANEHGISADQAFEGLRRYSQEENIKLHDVSLAVVERRLSLSRDKFPAASTSLVGGHQSTGE